MKNYMRKLLPLLLALILLLSLAPAALAEEEESILDQEKLDAWINGSDKEQQPECPFK